MVRETHTCLPAEVVDETNTYVFKHHEVVDETNTYVFKHHEVVDKKDAFTLEKLPDGFTSLAFCFGDMFNSRNSCL